MMAFDKILELLDNNKIEYVVHEHSAIPNVATAINVVDFDLDRCLKTLAFEYNDNIIFVCLPAMSKLDYAKLSKGLGINRQDIKMLDGAMLASLRFGDGGVAPFKINNSIKVLFDDSIQPNTIVYCGSGVSTKTIEINSSKLFEINNATILDLQKK
jgi:prolyl-tRNA editing enzyme YbaK/EbsC (Cys-tRNA(Pro) deacylase)